MRENWFLIKWSQQMMKQFYQLKSGFALKNILPNQKGGKERKKIFLLGCFSGEVFKKIKNP